MNKEILDEKVSEYVVLVKKLSEGIIETSETYKEVVKLLHDKGEDFSNEDYANFKAKNIQLSLMDADYKRAVSKLNMLYDICTTSFESYKHNDSEFITKLGEQDLFQYGVIKGKLESKDDTLHKSMTTKFAQETVNKQQVAVAVKNLYKNFV